MTGVTLAIGTGPMKPDASVVPQLQSLLQQIAKPREAVEVAFLDLGGRLSECAGSLRQITDAFEDLPRRLEGEDVAEAIRCLEVVTRKGAVMADSFAAERAGLDQLMMMVAAVERPISELSNTVKTIQLVAVNAPIAAAHLTGQRDDISVFTTDITRLAQNAARTIEEFSTVYATLLAAVRTANAERARFESAHKDTLSLLARRLDGSLVALAGHRRNAAAASFEIGHLSKQIAGGIGTAVSSLQIGDITRQRVEHVEEAFHSVLEHLSRRQYEPAGGSAVRSEQSNIAASASEYGDNTVVAAVCRLQSTQMDQAIADFDREVFQVANALRKLGADAEHVVRRSQKVFGSGSRRGQSLLDDLGNDLRGACAMIHDCEKARTGLDTAAAAVTKGVKDMLRHVDAVQEIEADMRLASLNMALKCSRLGSQGRTLLVIAYELRELAGKTVAAAEMVMTRLEGATTLAGSLNPGSVDDSTIQVGQLEEVTQRSVALLGSVDDSLKDALGVLAEDGAHVIKLLAEAASGVAVQRDIAGALRTCLTGIRSLAATSSGGASGDEQGVNSYALSLLQGRYTMASERLLHERALGQKPGRDLTDATMLLPLLTVDADLDSVFL